MRDMPLVSVITPSYQSAHFLPDCIKSVQIQDYPVIEHIIIDDGSTDNTASVVQAYDRPNLLYQFKQNGGQASARDAGLQIAKGQYILLLDADDALLPKAISRLVKHLQSLSDEKPGLVIGRTLHADEHLKPKGRSVNRPFAVTFDNLVLRNPIGGVAGVLMRTQDAKSIGGFNVSGTAGAEDWDLWIRFFRVGATFRFCTDAIALYRHSPSSYSRNPVKMFDSVKGVLEHCYYNDERLKTYSANAPILTDSQFNEMITKHALYYLGVAIALNYNDETKRHFLSFIDVNSLIVNPKIIHHAEKGFRYAQYGQSNRSQSCDSTIKPDLMWLLLSVDKLSQDAFYPIWQELTTYNPGTTEIITLLIKKLTKVMRLR